MENKLINLDLAKVTNEAQEKAKTLLSLAVTQENARSLESKRTEANKEIKAYKNSIEEAKAKYLEPFTAMEKQALEAIKPYEEATKVFSGEILDAKKAKREAEMREYYEGLARLAMSEDGELPEDFPSYEKAIDQVTSLTLPIQTAKDTILYRCTNYRKATANAMLTGTMETLRKVKEYAIGLGVEWEEI